MSNTDTRLAVLTPRQLRSLARLNDKQRERKIASYIAERICRMDVAHSRLIEGPLLAR